MSSLLYTYCNGLLALGSRKVLMQDDLWAVARCILVVFCHGLQILTVRSNITDRRLATSRL